MEVPAEEENAPPRKVTFTRHTYTVSYAGDAYFADHVFHLTDKQKKTADSYVENLTMFFGGSASGLAMAVGVSDEVLAYRATIQQVAQKYGMEAYVELLMAVMMQESGGRGSDPMQAAEGGFNKKYPHVPNGITDPAYSIECGIQELKYALDKAGCTGPTDLDRIKLALQGYNYGSGYIDWAMERDGGYTKENAIAYSDMMCARPNWHYDRYGDKEYVEHVLRYYQITNTGGSYPANGMQIPHYLQTDYGNIPYGGGSIASSGCGPTSFAMIASYLTGNTITPPDAVAWCGNSYYKPGVGTYWSYFQAAASHFGCGSVTQTSNANTVLQALSEGCPVISSQRAGLFTSGGHFIVLRGVTANGKVLVNDPNDSDAKNYINREFDMMSEIHATANATGSSTKNKGAIMNRTKVILSIFLMLFLLLAGLVLPSFWKSQKKEASGNKGREPAKETTETNSDTPMPEYLDFDALKAFFSDSQIASLKGQFPVYLKEYVKKEQTSITFLPEKTSYPTETTVCLMFSLSDQDTLPVTYHTPTGVFLFGEDGVQVSADTTVYEKQTDDSLPSLTSQDIEHLQEGGYPDTSDSPEAPDTESGSASVPSEDAKDTKKEVQP